jgi:hypothetical protein
MFFIAHFLLPLTVGCTETELRFVFPFLPEQFRDMTEAATLWVWIRFGSVERLVLEPVQRPRRW